jgi:hypothetical protein
MAEKQWQRMPPPPSIAGDAETTGTSALVLLALAWVALEYMGKRGARR